MKLACLGIVAALAFVAPSVSFAAVPEVKHASDFVGVGFSLTSSGEVVVYAGVREIGGKVAVCGLVWFDKATATTRVIEPKFTEKISFKIDGKGLRVSTRLFNRFKTKEDATTGLARCSVTQTVWKASYGKAKLKMSLGNVTVYE